MSEHSPFSQLPTTHLVYPMLYFSHSPLGGRSWAHPPEQREKIPAKSHFCKRFGVSLKPRANMQHCWMLHVASVNCMQTPLEVVLQSLKSVKILTT